MRKVFFSIVALILTVAAYALPMNIECTGAHEVDGATDTLFFFAGEIHVHSKIGAVDWYATATGVEVQTGSEYFYPEDGGYYIVKDGVEYSPFYVFRCQTSALQMTVEANCDNTILRFTGDLNPYTYTRRNGTQGSYKRTCSVEYTALAWNGEQWTDSAAKKEVTLSEAVRLDALYAATPIKVCYDSDIRETLGLAPACVTVNLEEEDVKAVSMHLTSVFTARNDSNEIDRPTDATVIVASSEASISGPFPVHFYCNPTPAAQYYYFRLYPPKGTVVKRSDPDTNYEFAEPGIYRVVYSVNNQHCESDSSEVMVQISESYLAVPNVFTPNGDGINDEFRVAFRSLREYHIWIYNRWGKLVYESTDERKGWDGTINGKKAAVGAYYYVIRALGTDADKNASYMMKPIYNKKMKNAENPLIGVYQLSGDINLLR